jgi:succinate dehydrogenase / fumarate reductase cytochrome b subunit
MDDAAVVHAQPGLGRLFERLSLSSLGLKYAMALSGLGLIGFLVGHLVGNLLIFKGPDAINQYAVGLQNLGALLWLLRAGVIVFFVVHVASAVALTKRNRKARPVRYAVEGTLAASYAARTMRYSGVIVLAYLIYHLAHFTFGWTSGGVDPGLFAQQTPDGHPHVYNMVVYSFQSPAVSLAYIVANVLVGVHLDHGAQATVQSLGLVTEPYRAFSRALGRGLAWALTAGFVSIPIAVLAGLIVPSA